MVSEIPILLYCNRQSRGIKNNSAFDRFRTSPDRHQFRTFPLKTICESAKLLTRIQWRCAGLRLLAALVCFPPSSSRDAEKRIAGRSSIAYCRGICFVSRILPPSFFLLAVAALSGCKGEGPEYVRQQVPRIENKAV